MHLVVPGQRRNLVLPLTHREVEAEFVEHCAGRRRSPARSAGHPAQPQLIALRIDQDPLRPNVFRNAVSVERDQRVIEPAHQRGTIPVKEPGFRWVDRSGY